MKLVNASGIGSVEELSEAAKQVLADTAYHFLLAGGRVSLDEWATLGLDERDALAAAGNQLRLEQAAILSTMNEPTEELEDDQQVLVDALGTV